MSAEGPFLVVIPQIEATPVNMINLHVIGEVVVCPWTRNAR